MIALKHVLVATDFSDASSAALEYGRQFARTFGATLHVIHVVENVMARFAADAYPVMVPDLQRDLDESGEERLRAALTSEDFSQLHAVPAIRTSASPASAIVQYAKDAKIDLIIMGTHGRGAVAHLLVGSVAERVVRTAACPVLTVRHPEREFIAPDAMVKAERSVGTAFLLLLLLGFGPGVWAAHAGTPEAAPPVAAAAQQAQPSEQAAPVEPSKPSDHAAHAAPAGNLELLVGQMRSATGEAKIALLADIVAALAAERASSNTSHAQSETTGHRMMCGDHGATSHGATGNEPSMCQHCREQQAAPSGSGGTGHH